jgi:hypothetical protein
MTDHDRATTRDQEHAEAEGRRRKDTSEHEGAAAGALLGTVAVGPLGAPVGAAAGAVVDALKPDPNAPPSHTHDADVPCYDGCPAWHSTKQ